jgi:hypothetical protein
MLYPYTDNYLDDPNTTPETKRAFNKRFALRLSGREVSPTSSHEATVYSLVAMIESQFDRSRYPAVFESLHAIHSAQRKSVQLLRRNASPYEVDVLGISIEKGGSSVLADAYLVAGSLDEDQASCAFGWGAFVQLVDDLQDVEEDARDGLQTVFSQSAGHWTLDAITNRALHFGSQVTRRLDCFCAQTAGPIKELMRQSAAQLLIQAAGAAHHYYTDAYLREIEPHSPFRFTFLSQQRERAAARMAPLVGLIEAFASVDDPESPSPFALP